jgi:hypothetical protein
MSQMCGCVGCNQPAVLRVLGLTLPPRASASPCAPVISSTLPACAQTATYATRASATSASASPSALWALIGEALVEPAFGSVVIASMRWRYL